MGVRLMESENEFRGKAEGDPNVCANIEGSIVLNDSIE